MIRPEIVNKLKSINELQLLIYLNEQENWNHCSVNRAYLSNYLDIAEITLKKNLRSLLDKGLIEKISKGIYKVNKKLLNG